MLRWQLYIGSKNFEIDAELIRELRVSITTIILILIEI